MDAYSEGQEANRRHMGELTRGAVLRLWNLQVRKGDRITEPSKFWKMPWDVERKSVEEVAREIDTMSDEERDAMTKEFLKRFDD